METKRLSEIAVEPTRLVKIDTDGLDFTIIGASTDWLSTAHPALLFEDQIRSPRDLRNANETFQRLSDIGYAFFIVWDDPGLHIVWTTSLETIYDLTRYLFQLSDGDNRKTIHNHDVLCLNEADADVYNSINSLCRETGAKP